MASIRLKAVEGRIARHSPNGNFIPHDRFVRVKLTPYIERLIHVHGDVIVEPEPTEKVAIDVPETATAAPAPAPVSRAKANKETE